MHKGDRRNDGFLLPQVSFTGQLLSPSEETTWDCKCPGMLNVLVKCFGSELKGSSHSPSIPTMERVPVTPGVLVVLGRGGMQNAVGHPFDLHLQTAINAGRGSGCHTTKGSTASKKVPWVGDVNQHQKMSNRGGQRF